MGPSATPIKWQGGTALANVLGPTCAHPGLLGASDGVGNWSRLRSKAGDGSLYSGHGISEPW